MVTRAYKKFERTGMYVLALKTQNKTKMKLVLHMRSKHAFSYLVYLAIRLRARDFYEVIVDEGEARITCYLMEIESE